MRFPIKMDAVRVFLRYGGRHYSFSNLRAGLPRRQGVDPREANILAFVAAPLFHFFFGDGGEGAVEIADVVAVGGSVGGDEDTAEDEVERIERPLHQPRDTPEQP
jgi:hypothetical protein